MDIEAMALEEAGRIIGGDTADDLWWHQPLDTGDRNVWLASILAAFGRRLLSCPVPGPAGEEMLAKARAALESSARRLGEAPHVNSDFGTTSSYAGVVVSPESAADILRQLDHLEAILRDCAADGMLAVWRQGYERGLEEGRRPRRKRSPTP